LPLLGLALRFLGIFLLLDTSGFAINVSLLNALFESLTLFLFALLLLKKLLAH